MNQFGRNTRMGLAKMNSPNKVSIEQFFGSFCLFSLLQCVFCYLNLTAFVIQGITFGFLWLTLISLLWICLTREEFEIAWRASMLGVLCSLGIIIFSSAPSHINIFGLYMSVMSFFHFSEFVTIATIQPKKLTTDSFVINHSPQYTIAAITSWIEFFLESYFFPGLKQLPYISYLGLGICIWGELLRKTAMFTAGSNFNHLVQSEKAKDHVLVTSGVYAFFRHPSYVGWFYWAIGTQLILVNPICTLMYVVVSWLFFNSRIYIEEITLLNFFGQSYVEYQKKVGTGIPFVKGYEI